MSSQKTLVSSKELDTSLKVAFLYFSGKKQNEIAKQLGLTTSTVSRALTRARQFVELKYSVPGNEELEGKLLLKFGLKDAMAVETGSSEQAVSIVGQAAAKYFRINVNSGDRVAVSCGETLLEMVKGIPHQSSLILTVSQLSIEGDPNSIHQAPAALVGLLRSKLSSESVAAGVQLPPCGTVSADREFRAKLRDSAFLEEMRKRALDSNFVFIGVAPVSKTTVQAKSFQAIKDRTVTSALSHAIKKLRICGEINNRLFDEKGQDRTDEIPELANYFINVLDLDDLRNMSRRGAKIVLIATGIGKVDAIRVALQTGIANVIVTDREVAMRLIEG
jgi:DNA-binding transcriptional regulator LsrR (DeoR family)